MEKTLSVVFMLLNQIFTMSQVLVRCKCRLGGDVKLHNNIILWRCVMNNTGYTFTEVVKALSQVLMSRLDRRRLEKAASIINKNDLHEDFFLSQLKTEELRKLKSRLEVTLRDREVNES